MRRRRAASFSAEGSSGSSLNSPPLAGDSREEDSASELDVPSSREDGNSSSNVAPPHSRGSNGQLPGSVRLLECSKLLDTMRRSTYHGVCTSYASLSCL